MMKADVAFDPVDIGSLGTQGQMLDASNVSDLFEEFHGRLPGKDYPACGGLASANQDSAASRASIRSTRDSVHVYKMQSQAAPGVFLAACLVRVRIQPAVVE